MDEEIICPGTFSRDNDTVFKNANKYDKRMKGETKE